MLRSAWCGHITIIEYPDGRWRVRLVQYAIQIIRKDFRLTVIDSGSHEQATPRPMRLIGDEVPLLS